MTKKLFLTLWFIASSLLTLQAQQWQEVKAHPEQFICGEGWGATVDEADHQALAALVSQLSVAVSNDFSITEDERTMALLMPIVTRVANSKRTHRPHSLTPSV